MKYLLGVIPAPGDQCNKSTPELLALAIDLEHTTQHDVTELSVFSARYTNA